ncbi:unnamed protein product [Penicillium roqueforti FM164]|uniref:HNH nuclease domain-containing protein n=1 Tax=Penicillium roqueforti (strain FM164) TaxID=1365484 RepID=W6QQA8_PENRF|nr:unnamed protein product [Penicillium roqueforti FM164]
MEPLDDQNIFSEFEDEERRQLIEELIRQDPRLAELPRTNFFTLWFSDIEVLRVFANVLQRGDPNFKWRKYLLSTPDPSDVPGVFASSKQANKSSSKGKSSSGSRLPVPAQSPAGRTRSTSPRKGQPGLRERSINTPRTSWDDQQNPLGESSTSVQQSPSLGQDLTLCLERDSNRCIITKRDHPGIQCAHIIPYKLNGSSTRGATWEWLENFWGEARADRWKAELLGGSNHQINTEQVKNITTGIIALTHPLPSEELLKMQWILSRIASSW